MQIVGKKIGKEFRQALPVGRKDVEAEGLEAVDMKDVDGLPGDLFIDKNYATILRGKLGTRGGFF